MERGLARAEPSRNGNGERACPVAGSDAHLARKTGIGDFEPLRDQVQEQSRQYGKLVDLDLQGTELDLDYESLQILADPIRRLALFAVTDGIKDIAKRLRAGW